MKEDRRDTAPEAGASLTAGEADDGCRVDALLSRLVPGMGVRGRRRFLKEGEGSSERTPRKSRDGCTHGRPSGNRAAEGVFLLLHA